MGVGERPEYLEEQEEPEAEQRTGNGKRGRRRQNGRRRAAADRIRGSARDEQQRRGRARGAPSSAGERIGPTLFA